VNLILSLKNRICTFDDEQSYKFNLYKEIDIYIIIMEEIVNNPIDSYPIAKTINKTIICRNGDLMSRSIMWLQRSPDDKPPEIKWNGEYSRHDHPLRGKKTFPNRKTNNPTLTANNPVVINTFTKTNNNSGLEYIFNKLNIKKLQYYATNLGITLFFTLFFYFVF